MAKNFPNLIKHVHLQIRRSETLKHKNYKENHTQVPIVSSFKTRESIMKATRENEALYTQKDNANDLYFILKEARRH